MNLLVGILCLAAGIGQLLMQYPSTRVAWRQWREIRAPKDAIENLRAWDRIKPFVSPTLSIALIVVGLLVLVVLPRHERTRGVIIQKPAESSTQQSAPTPAHPVPDTVPHQEKSQSPAVVPSKPKYPSVQQAAPQQRAATPSPNQSVGSVDCTSNSGNCAGINLGTQISNRFGPPQMNLDDAQLSMITDGMRPFAGRKAGVAVRGERPDGWNVARKLVLALRNAGLIVNDPGQGFGGTPPDHPGFAVAFSTDNKDAYLALAQVLYASHVVANPPAEIPANAPGTGVFEITVNPPM